MLGIMNSPVDSAEFLASPRRSSDVEVLKVFSEPKTKPAITYTKDGRRIMNGELEKKSAKQPNEMWADLLTRVVVAQKVHVKNSNENCGDKRMMECNEEMAKPNEELESEVQEMKKSETEESKISASNH